MKKRIILIVILLSQLSYLYPKNNLKAGDSLAILYYRVYAYKNPNDLSTRISVNPLSYRNKNKLVFIENSKDYEGYYKVAIQKGIEAYVKSNRLSSDQNLSHSQIRQDIEKGKRFKFHGVKYKVDNNIPGWYFLIGFVLLLIIAYFLYKKYVILDSWFCKKARSKSKPLDKPWFIKYSLFPGLVIGGFQLLAPKEFTWFRMEGIQIWGSYPSILDWVLWGSLMSIFVVCIFSIIQAFRRFSIKYATIYSGISLIVISFYLFIGGITGGLVTAILMMAASGGGSGKSEGSSGSSSSNGSGDNLPTGAFKYIDGQRHIKNTGGGYDKY